MTTQKLKSEPRAGDWDVYWRGTAENAAHRQGGPQEPVLATFWGRFFAENLADHAGIEVLDLACGNGAVTGYARQVAPELEGYGADYSESALRALKKRYPASRCVVADARHPPFAGQSFGIVASQFGVEYAGSGAISAAGRLVAPGGWLALVLHLHGGGIYRECAVNLEVIQAVQQCAVMALAREAFAAGFALNAGTGSVESFKAAERAFTPAIRKLEEILKQWGDKAADGLPRQLYQDIAHMYQRMSAFEATEVMGWIDGMVNELAAYNGRMSSMLDAAISEDMLEAECSGLAALGFTVASRDTLQMGPGGEAAAWALVLRRGEDAAAH